MQKDFFRNTRRLAALCGVGFFLCGYAGAAMAFDQPPVPVKKPDFTQELPAEGITVLHDFVSGLLNFGAPPVPKPRPFKAATGPLPSDQAQLYKNIFAMQAAGKMREADYELARLKDLRLRGHVLYQRYLHPTAYITNFDELADWLALYGDYPGAGKIYKLAVAKKPADYKGHIPKPAAAKGIARLRDPMMYAGQSYHPAKKRSKAESEAAAAFKKSVKALIRAKELKQAQAKLTAASNTALLDVVEFDLLQAQIAKAYMYQGDLNTAYDLASASAQRSGIHVPLSGWIAGLVSWQRGQYQEAADFFTVVSRSAYASSWTAAAGSYWAARSYMKTGDVQQVSTWLKRAAEHPRTFYGLVATRALGQDFKFNWSFPAFTKAHKALLEKDPIGARALALVEAGQIHLAESELLRINPQDKAMSDALLAYAGHAGLPALALRVGSAYEGPEGIYYDAALYPTGQWKAKDDYKIDPALIHAIMRQESKFDADAESPSGAMGLMQLMPRTASFIAGRNSLTSKAGHYELMDPRVNIGLGEKYLQDLLRQSNVDGDLVSLLIAYNAGPGNLARWKNQWTQIEDPLLFVELIPSGETRAYVERVLANYWIYRMRDDLPVPTLEAISEGRAALYADAQDAAQSYQVANSQSR